VRKEGVYLDENETAIFFEPFRPLYFCADEIVALHANTPESSPIKQHLLLLLKVMGEIFSGVRAQVRNLQAGGLISYKLAWIYFRRGITVYSPGRDTERVFEVVDAKYESKPPHLLVIGREVVFDGTNYTYEKIELALMAFTGNRPITKLPLYPLSFHDNPESITTRLTERGKRVLEYQGLTYCMYTGVGYHSIGQKVEKYNVSYPRSITFHGNLTNSRLTAVFSSTHSVMPSTTKRKPAKEARASRTSTIQSSINLRTRTQMPKTMKSP
jgi:hypothetical protein